MRGIILKKFNLLAEPEKQEIIITHIYDAPRELVWKTYTDPKLRPQWWGPENVETTVEKMDVRTGGEYRVTQHTPNGIEVTFHGVYHEILASERIVQTEEFEGMPGHVVLETIIFEDFEGKTKVTDTSITPSVEDRDLIISTGMEEGVIESDKRFNKLLKELQKKS
jgi:uncharacterized protein YndB with AHSA1/START domain